MSQILVVDDIPTNLEVLSTILESQGHKVRVATNGQQAIELVYNEPPDLILLDILMPGITGYDVCRQLKADPAVASIPVVFVSALDETFDKVQAFEVGGVDYITKPFQAEEVIARAEIQLEVGQLQKKLIEQIKTEENINRQLSEANARLKNLLKDREEIFSIMAHDLGNILAVMALKLDLLKEHYDSLTVEKVFRNLDALKDAKDQMVLVITRLLDVAQIDDKPINVKLQTVSPGEIISQVLDQYKGLASEKHIALQYEAPKETYQLQTDPTLLGEVLSNLVSNALKYSPPDTTVVIRLSKDSQYMTIAVEDEGLGLSKEDHAKLFTKFARLSARPTGGEKSLGLGLYIVKKLIAAMGGTITASSLGIKQGSTFTVRLPMSNKQPSNK
ncbi:MAG: hybrid sensor histidine kinase/response regulator [Anaerolineae bacterium]|nr:hybrid sensor histidine kinase/response regulator [Anaerolineae bacterium]